MRTKLILCAVAAALTLHGASLAAAAEIRLAKQYSMGYLQLNVMEHQQLIEKHAKALGIPDLKVSWITLNGPAAVNDALISGNIDIATGGVPGLLVLWARTKGTPQEVRGISALQLAAVPAQQPRPGHQDNQGLQGYRPHRGAGRQGFGAGDHAANGGGQGLRHQGLRHARPAHRVDVAARCHDRAAGRKIAK